MDVVRATIADAFGHAGTRARIHSNVVGELAGDAPFNAAGHPPGEVVIVKGYSRVSKKVKRERVAERERTPPPLPPPTAPASPGYRARNYIRENDGDDGDGGGGDGGGGGGGGDDDPLAVPVGGRAPRDGGARASTSGGDASSRERAAAVVAAGEGLWAELAGEAAEAAAAAAAAAAEAAAIETPDAPPPPAKRPRAPRARRKQKADPPPPTPPPPASLPPSLERLCVAYARVATAAAFVARQKIHPAWRFISSALTHMTRAATSDGDVDVDVTLDDLHVMAALCPGSLRLTPCAHRRVDANEEEGGGGGGGGGGGAATADDEIDVLLRVTAPTPGRSARDVPIREEEDARERERAMTDEIEVVIHGQRTSGRIARDDDDGDDDDDDDGTGAKKRRRRRSARTAPGAAAVKKRVDAFRRGVALALAAEMDATRAAGGAAGDDDEKALREIVDALDTAAFARRAEAERRDARSARSHGAARDDALEPLAPLAPPRSTTTTKTKTRCRCRRADALSVDEFIAHLTSDEDALGARGQCAHRIDVPARELKIGPTCDARAPGLSPAVADALHAAGVPFAFAGEGEGEGDRDAAVDRPPRRLSLFSHQHFGVAAALARRNVVVATGTASGKSVCYNAPVLQALTSDAAATALYLFPTKALAQDQLRALRVMLRAAAAARGDDARVPVFVPSAGVYDGDTSDAERARIEREDRLVITNPDMLHVNVLPNHRKWRAMLTGLRYVVIDEAHAYRGVFGSHVALVIRRLRRLCRELYGGEPTFIVTSATIAAPGNHARDLVGAFPIAAGGGGGGGDGGGGDDDDDDEPHGWVVVDDDGSPCGEKTFLMWNPPVKDPPPPGKPGKKPEDAAPRGKAAVAKRLRGGDAADAADADAAAETETETETAAGDAFTPVWKARETARRAKTHGLSLTSDAAAALGKGTLGVYGSGPRRTSPVVEISALLAECVRHDLKCIAFCKTKKLCELVLKYTREALASTGAPSLCGSVLAYRGGYSSVDRRAIEKALFSGSVRGVAATNALELGVDVGALDVTLHLGFPGTVASLIQQAGRAGRRGKRALSVYVAFDGPLDQHFMRSPAKLFGRPIERAAIDPCNPSVMEAHVACASHEMPLDPRVLPKSAITDGGGRDARLYFGSALEVVCDRLRERRLVVPDASLLGEWKASLDVRLRWCGASPPANGVSVRAIEEERYRIVDERTGECVEEVERSKAFWEVYPGAVYMNQARTFLCVSLDVKKLTAVVRLADVKYFTKMVDKTTVTTLANASTTVAYPDRATSVTGAASRPANRESSAQSARAEVAVTFFGYRKIWHASGTCFDTVPLRETLPDVSYTTIAAWVRVPDVARRMCADAGVEFRAGVHAATHAGAFYTKVFHPSFGFNI